MCENTKIHHALPHERHNTKIHDTADITVIFIIFALLKLAGILREAF
ncbi:MAG: hypothetical protein LBI79_00565 [Nitrososphaerota archaeon]|nr:hypothetical protein [Nitrososphaerota archaeon]